MKARHMTKVALDIPEELIAELLPKTIGLDGSASQATLETLLVTRLLRGDLPPLCDNLSDKEACELFTRRLARLLWDGVDYEIFSHMAKELQERADEMQANHRRWIGSNWKGLCMEYIDNLRAQREHHVVGYPAGPGR
jgi:hypothetical protein